MKPCVCGGGNSNCRFCRGSGYVEDRQGLPSPIPKESNPFLGQNLPPIEQKRMELDVPREYIERRERDARRRKIAVTVRDVFAVAVYFVALLVIASFLRHC